MKKISRDIESFLNQANQEVSDIQGMHKAMISEINHSQKMVNGRKGAFEGFTVKYEEEDLPYENKIRT